MDFYNWCSHWRIYGSCAYFYWQ